MKISLYYIALINALLLSACSNAVEEVSQPPKNPTEVVDTEAPVILGTTPAANAANIDKFSSVSVSFSEKIDSASLNEQSVKLFYLPAGQNRQLMMLNSNEGIKYSNLTLVISPKQPFIEGGLYQVRLLANPDSELSIKDPAGNVLEANDQNIYYTWTFTISTVVQNALTAIFPLKNSVVDSNVTPVVITLNPNFYRDADISESKLQDTIILSETDIPENLCQTPIAATQRIKGAVTASLQNGDASVEKTITFTPDLPGYKLSAPIYVYVCLTNNSGGELLYKTWSFIMRDGKFQKAPDQPLLLVTDGRLLADNTIVDAMGNVTIFWKKAVYNGTIPNEVLIADDYYTRRFDASSGSWLAPSGSPITNNPAANISYLSGRLSTYVDPQGRIMAIWGQGNAYYSNWFY